MKAPLAGVLCLGSALGLSGPALRSRIGSHVRGEMRTNGFQVTEEFYTVINGETNPAVTERVVGPLLPPGYPQPVLFSSETKEVLLCEPQYQPELLSQRQTLQSRSRDSGRSTSRPPRRSAQTCLPRNAHCSLACPRLSARPGRGLPARRVQGQDLWRLARMASSSVRFQAWAQVLRV